MKAATHARRTPRRPGAEPLHDATIRQLLDIYPQQPGEVLGITRRVSDGAILGVAIIAGFTVTVGVQVFLDGWPVAWSEDSDGNPVWGRGRQAVGPYLSEEITRGELVELIP